MALEWPALPPSVRKIDAVALAHHRRSQSALATNLGLGQLLAEIVDRERDVTVHATRRAAVLQLPVCDLDDAKRQLNAAAPSITHGWSWQALGRSVPEQQRARKLAIVASAATLAATVDEEAETAAAVAGAASEMKTAVVMVALRERVAAGSSQSSDQCHVEMPGTAPVWRS